MKYKYGCYQSSGTACIFYKKDENEKQSTFNVFVSPKKDAVDKKEIFVIVDNDQIKKESWFGTKDLEVGDVYREYGNWASDAPNRFNLDAQKSLGNLLRTELRVADVTRETKVEGKADIKILGAEVSHKTKKELKK